MTTLTTPVWSRGRLVLARFHIWLSCVGVAGLAVRVVACILGRKHPVQGDAWIYQLVAQELADGHGFTKLGETTTEHPPLWEVVLAGADLIGLNGNLSHRLVGALLGTVTVVLLGLLGRRLGGNWVGLAAAGIAAVYPPLWAADVTIMSESLYGVLLAGALVAATYRRPVVLGVFIALAALTRGEALALVVVLAVPLFWRQWRKLALTLVACAVVLAPWTIRNLVTFDEPVLVSSNSGLIWISANCDSTYYGSHIGSWDFACNVDRLPGEDESEYASREQRLGQQYILDHADRVPAVAAVRFLRLLDLWNLPQTVFINASEGRPATYVKLGFLAFWLLLPCAIAGATILVRRRDPKLFVLLAPVVLVVAVSLMLYGSTRFRFAAEPSIVVLAAMTLVATATSTVELCRRRRAT